jgi:hypothetical protein
MTMIKWQKGNDKMGNDKDKITKWNDKKDMTNIKWQKWNDEKNDVWLIFFFPLLCFFVGGLRN